MIARLATSLLPTMQIPASEPTIDVSTVFPPGLNGGVRYRIPRIVVTPKGTVLAYAEGREGTGTDWGEIEIHMRRSTDGG